MVITGLVFDTIVAPGIFVHQYDLYLSSLIPYLKVRNLDTFSKVLELSLTSESRLQETFNIVLYIFPVDTLSVLCGDAYIQYHQKLVSSASRELIYHTNRYTGSIALSSLSRKRRSYWNGFECSRLPDQEASSSGHAIH